MKKYIGMLSSIIIALAFFSGAMLFIFLDSSYSQILLRTEMDSKYEKNINTVEVKDLSLNDEYKRIETLNNGQELITTVNIKDLSAENELKRIEFLYSVKRIIVITVLVFAGFIIYGARIKLKSLEEEKEIF